MNREIMTTCFLSIETFANVTIVTNVIDTNYKKYHILDLEVSSLSLSCLKNTRGGKSSNINIMIFVQRFPIFQQEIKELLKRYNSIYINQDFSIFVIREFKNNC